MVVESAECDTCSFSGTRGPSLRDEQSLLNADSTENSNLVEDFHLLGQDFVPLTCWINRDWSGVKSSTLKRVGQPHRNA